MKTIEFLAIIFALLAIWAMLTFSVTHNPQLYKASYGFIYVSIASTLIYCYRLIFRKLFGSKE